MPIIHRPALKHQNADCLSHHQMPNNSENPAGVPEDQEGVKHVFGLHVVDLRSEFYNKVAEGYNSCKNLKAIIHILKHPEAVGSSELIASLDDEYKKIFTTGS